MKRLYSILILSCLGISLIGQSKKVTALSEDTQVHSNDLLYVVDQSATSKKMLMDTLLNQTVSDTATQLRSELADTASQLRSEIGGGTLWSNTGDKVYFTSINDSLGLGTSSPSEKLEVSGNIQGTDVIATSDLMLSSLTYITESSSRMRFYDSDNITGVNLNDLKNTYTAGNLITLAGSAFSFGGYASDNASVYMNGYNLQMFSNVTDHIYLQDNYIEFYANDLFRIYSDSTDFVIDTDADSWYLRDYRTAPVGLQYHGDYSSTIKANDRSIPDVGTVKNIVSDSTVSISFGSQYEIPYTNATTDDFDYGSDFTYNGIRLLLGSGDNIFLGTNTGTAITTGTRNFGIGTSAGRYKTSGQGFIGIGYQAGMNNTTLSHNISIGQQALKGGSSWASTGNVAIGGFAGTAIATGGHYNLFLGYNSGYSNTSGGRNIFTGSHTGYSNVTGSGNVFIGDSAGYNETGSNKLYIDNSSTSTPLIWGDFSEDSVIVNGNINITGTINGSNLRWNDTVFDIQSSVGSNSLYIGNSTLSSVSTADNNVGLGYRALEDITTGDGNTSIGSSSGWQLTTGSSNTSIGYNAMMGSVTGSNNTATGVQAGAAITSGIGNAIFGAGAGVAITEGDDNVTIGTNAGSQITTGDNNLIIGDDVASAAGNFSNQFWLDNSNTATPLLYGEFDNDILKINGTQIKSTGTIADNDATPDVSGAEVWTYGGSSNSVTVTDLDNPDVGAIYRIIGNSATYTITINDGGNFNLSGNWTGGVDDVITIYVQADNDYIELSRSDN